MQAALKTQQNLKLFCQSQKVYSSSIRKEDFLFQPALFFWWIFSKKGKKKNLSFTYTHLRSLRLKNTGDLDMPIIKIMLSFSCRQYLNSIVLYLFKIMEIKIIALF